jgi:hypothetical protein
MTPAAVAEPQVVTPPPFGSFTDIGNALDPVVTRQRVRTVLTTTPGALHPVQHLALGDVYVLPDAVAFYRLHVSAKDMAPERRREILREIADQYHLTGDVRRRFTRIGTVLGEEGWLPEHRLVGGVEAARILGVTPKKADVILSAQKAPRPVAVLARGRVWLAVAIEEYAASPRRPGPGGHDVDMDLVHKVWDEHHTMTAVVRALASSGTGPGIGAVRRRMIEAGMIEAPPPAKAKRTPVTVEEWHEIKEALGGGASKTKVAADFERNRATVAGIDQQDQPPARMPHRDPEES